VGWRTIYAELLDFFLAVASTVPGTSGQQG